MQLVSVDLRASKRVLKLRFQGRGNCLGWSDRSDALCFQYLQAIYDNLKYTNML